MTITLTCPICKTRNTALIKRDIGVFTAATLCVYCVSTITVTGHTDLLKEMKK